MSAPWRFPRVLVCASDSLADLDAAELPVWAQTTIVIAKTYIQPVEIDIAARVESGRDLEKVKNALKGVSKHIYVDNLSHDAPVPRVPVKPEHTHVVLVGIEPLIAINDDLTTVYIPTASQPVSCSYAFSRLGSNGFVILLEKEARTLLAEFTPEQEQKVTTLTGRELVRALVAQPALNGLRGVVVLKGENGLAGCVVSTKVAVMDFDEDEDEDEDDYEREERYEFEIDPAIIEGTPGSTSGCVAAFVGKFIASLVQGAASIPSLKVYNESQFAFQLEQSCVAAATVALSPSSKPFATRVPRLGELSKNFGQYIYGLRMLKMGENGPTMQQLQRTVRPPMKQTSWRAPA